MHSTSLDGSRASNTPNLFAFSVGEIIWCSIALFFFLVSWAVGGDDFKNSIGGNYSLLILLVGIAIGAVFAALSRPHS